MTTNLKRNRNLIFAIAIGSTTVGAAYGVPWLQETPTQKQSGSSINTTKGDSKQTAGEKMPSDQLQIIKTIHSLPDDSDELAGLRKSLRSLVESELEQRFARQAAELKLIEERLEVAKAQLDQRQGKKNEIVDWRVGDLLQKSDGSDWVLPLEQTLPYAKIDNELDKGPSDTRSMAGTESAVLTTGATLTEEGGLTVPKDPLEITSTMNEALALQAMFDTMSVEDSVGWFRPSNKAKAAEVSKRIRLLELKLDFFHEDKISKLDKLEAELTARDSVLALAEKDFQRSHELFSKGAESIIDVQRKEMELELASNRVKQQTIELRNFKDQIENLAKRVNIVRKKFADMTVGRYAPPFNETDWKDPVKSDGNNK